MHKLNYSHFNNIYIDIEKLDIYYQIFKKNINKDLHLYFEIISIPKNKNDYKNIYKNILFLSKRYNNINHSNCYISNGKIIQIGGYGMFLSGLSITAFSGLILFFLYLLHKKQKFECKKKYPMYDQDKLPNIGEILEKIVPSNWINNRIKEGKSIEKVINEIIIYLEKMNSIFVFLDESEGSNLTKGIKTTIKISLSIGSAIASLGQGGDNVISIPILITKSIKILSKIFSKIQKIIMKIYNILKKLIDKLNKINNTIKNIINVVDVIHSEKDSLIKNIKNKSNHMRFIFDLLNINFKGGPFHCRCWMEYLMNIYINDNSDLEEMMELICIINDIYKELNKDIIHFIGVTIDVIVPDTLGLAGSLAPLLENYSYIIYKNVRDQITYNYYKNIPKNIQIILQEPEKLKEYIFYFMKKQTFGVSEKIITSEMKKNIDYGLDILSYSINKCLSLMFLFLNIFIIFSEINSGIEKKFINKSLTSEKMINDCQKFIENKEKFMKIYEPIKQISKII